MSILDNEEAKNAIVYIPKEVRSFDTLKFFRNEATEGHEYFLYKRGEAPGQKWYLAGSAKTEEELYKVIKKIEERELIAKYAKQREQDIKVIKRY